MVSLGEDGPWGWSGVIYRSHFYVAAAPAPAKAGEAAFRGPSQRGRVVIYPWPPRAQEGTCRGQAVAKGVCD